ncbi:MAG: type II/IV secretion system protein [Deltaproteobacteria bacterium]|nr:type II/IV secretion system protein [Deltaproteobacteria bacterium]MBW1955687.1 type II/IV secretion system protein [Deltaproteobacteria bacterium]MBW2041176.1 type II/IV secretion system protein [Deltaproteobacteria bacterium]MBW2131960.1 type II/IV secretion system protein [Deltaproteobacteria bacterium]
MHPSNGDKSPFSLKAVCGVLYQKGLISKAQAQQVLTKGVMLQKKRERDAEGKGAHTSSGGPASEGFADVDLLVSLNLERADNPALKLDEDAVYEALAAAWKIPYRKIDPLKLDLNLVTTTIPRTFAMRHLVLPIGVKDGALTVATPDPFNMEALEDIARASLMKVHPVVSPKRDIVKLIGEFFGFKRSISQAEIQFAGPVVDLGNLEQYVKLRSSDELPATDQHIVNAVNYLFTYAFEQRASDIHIEPKRKVSKVRMRIDGVLHNVYDLPKTVHSAIVSRIKTLSRMDMAEKRRPQDGRIKMDKGDVEVEIRVSTIPVAFGEKLVLRIMDPDILFQDLDHLGFSSTDLIRYNHFINMPHGIVLVCGPTGSGKSTTLYSTLRTISSPEVNVTTVEDPIEMVHESFNQIGVQPMAGVTFSSILRNILRQDPDIIMIGEMRDLETAENAVQAALTGHLVLSTLHTNDAASAITRLLDLGVPPFLIQSTLIGVLGQRLVRKICIHCQETFEMDSSELREMGLDPGREGRIALKRGKGCLKCRGTGFLGRTAVYEVLPCTEAIKKQIVSNADLNTIQSMAKREGMVTLRENAVRKMLAGETTYQEVLRVTWEQG